MRDRFRDPFGWVLDALPWSIRRLYVAARFREWPPDNVRYLGFRKSSQADLDRGEELAKEHGW